MNVISVKNKVANYLFIAIQSINEDYKMLLPGGFVFSVKWGLKDFGLEGFRV